MRIGTQRRLAQSVVVCLIALSASACERKAPSPEECLDFAMLGLRVSDQRLLAVPAVKEKVERGRHQMLDDTLRQRVDPVC